MTPTWPEASGALPGPRRQAEIYLRGVAGEKPVVPVDAVRLEEAARRRMSREAHAYVAGGAGAEATVRANREAFDRRRIVPRVLRDVSERTLAIDLFGRTIPAPILLAPIGVLELVHAAADLAVARAAAAFRLPFIFSNQASVPMEDCARAMGDAPRWFQLYWSKNDALVASFVGRAEASGCDAIVVTLDTAMLGWRGRDLDLAYLPFLRGKGLAQYTSDPVFRATLAQPAPPPAADVPRQVTRQSIAALAEVRRRASLAAVRHFVGTYSRTNLTWSDLRSLRERTKLPILLKGILHPDDARAALEHGIDGLIVSNHGGRQVDGSIATLDALPGVVAAVAGRIPVLLDGGIRGGADAFKALALGARAVCVGRPYAYALAAGGEVGVRELLANLIAELDLTLGLSGHRSVAELGPDSLS
ncbi:MAG TPA: alpha-hydroxy-acid oxidizing protein [Candidatus Limnocylindria bacterium]|nr:alpha-hydroxy-acid oxidizing protein [Candidatus Limnocylindria bacterium]